MEAVGWAGEKRMMETRLPPRPSFARESPGSPGESPGKRCLLFGEKQHSAHMSCTPFPNSTTTPAPAALPHPSRAQLGAQAGWILPSAPLKAGFSTGGSRWDQSRFNVKSHVLSIIPQNMLVGFSTCNHTSGIKAGKKSRISCHVLYCQP